MKAYEKNYCHEKDALRSICISVQTTGLNPEKDEILQISVIDGNGNVLLDTLVRPYFIKTWPDAESIHGITPETVSHSIQLFELMPTLQRMIYSANSIIVYNKKFVMQFLGQAGIGLAQNHYYDVMIEFAKIYNDWNDYFGNYRYQSLTTCANYYGLDFHTQNNLEKARAILHCYKKIIENSDMQL